MKAHLSYLIAVPAVGAALSLICKNFSKSIGIGFSCLQLILLGVMYVGFDRHGGYQFIEFCELLPHFDYHIGADPISIYFLLLTGMLTPLAIVANFKLEKQHLVVTCILILESMMMGVFASINLLLFFIFFEASLIPLFFIIGIWGGEDKIKAAFKIFFFTFSGAALLLVSIVYIMPTASNFIALRESPPHNIWLLIGIFIAFAIKVPIWPFHTWLPLAHVQAPTGGSMILAGIVLKAGGYGIIRFLAEAFKTDEFVWFEQIIIFVSLVSVIYASMVAFAQTNLKKLIAYSSIAHMGYVTAGIFSGTKPGLDGAVFQMISHGLVSSGLFFLVGILFERTNTKEIADYSGVATHAPKLAIVFMCLSLGAIGFPGTSGFIGEVLIIFGLAKGAYLTYSCALAFCMILTAVYMISLYSKTMFGVNKGLLIADLSTTEKLVLYPIALTILALGIYPKIILMS